MNTTKVQNCKASSHDLYLGKKSTRAKNVNYRREVTLFNSNFTSDAAVYSLNYILSQIEEDATDIFLDFD